MISTNVRVQLRQHILFLDLSAGGHGQRSVLTKVQKKGEEYLDSVLRRVCVELGGHFCQEEEAMCVKNGLSAVSAVSVIRWQFD